MDCLKSKTYLNSCSIKPFMIGKINAFYFFNFYFIEIRCSDFLPRGLLIGYTEAIFSSYIPSAPNLAKAGLHFLFPDYYRSTQTGVPNRSSCPRIPSTAHLPH